MPEERFKAAHGCPANEAQVTLALDASGQDVRRSNDGEELLPGIALV